MKTGCVVLSPGEREEPKVVRRIALLVEYEGTRYKGFQWQVRLPSIQAELEAAIERLTGGTNRVRCASRTDAGAHATGQIVDFLTAALYPAETFINALNWYLPDDVRVRGCWDRPLGFNSRRDAISRVYRYTVLNCPWPTALLRNFSHWVSGGLDVNAMNHAAQDLRGTHDFSPFTAALAPGKSPVRRVCRWDVWREGDLVLIESEANAFLPHQIRRTNGVLLQIGLGRLPTGVIKRIFDGTMRELTKCPSLPAKGLCLVKVNYAPVAVGESGKE